MYGARGSEAQRAEAVARHQGRFTPGGAKIWVKYRGFICIFFMIPGVYLGIFFMIPGFVFFS